MDDCLHQQHACAGAIKFICRTTGRCVQHYLQYYFFCPLPTINEKDRQVAKIDYFENLGGGCRGTTYFGHPSFVYSENSRLPMPYGAGFLMIAWEPTKLHAHEAETISARGRASLNAMELVIRSAQGRRRRASSQGRALKLTICSIPFIFHVHSSLSYKIESSRVTCLKVTNGSLMTGCLRDHI